jgi:hypothetical protein
MPTERITLDLEGKALYAARVAAQAKDMSLADWVSKTLWTQAIAEAAEVSAENERRFPDEPPGWKDAAEAHVFGEDDA